jgi:flagellar basal body rod protein FlgG
MLYGLYESATGVMANSHRLDVIANNIANSETVGFKKMTSPFRERLTQAQENPADATWSDPLLESLGGGLLLAPSAMDLSQGDLMPSDNKLDLGIQGGGYFAVSDKGTTRLTRDGRFQLDQQGNLVTADGSSRPVLGADLKPISLDATKISTTTIDVNGQITQAGAAAGQVGLFTVPDATQLTPHGNGQFDYPDLQNSLSAATGAVRSGFTERANVDPVTEMTHMMDAERELEANANMLRLQDQTLATLTQQVAKMT